MRRTYRSKKDTGGGLDHKDVLLTLDERSSVFDAFYIQKIKQTKRELSCMGSSSQYTPASYKVRKKKFVKRIVKEVESTPDETMSKSTYLTPDKSIRVNKGQDLFDQLLNTCSPDNLQCNEKKDDVSNQVRPVRQPKTYSTRKARKVKKYNYSSSDSYETDKENDTNNSSTNITDIGAHKLIIEKGVPNIPKNQDESINKIVQNLSIFNNMKKSNNSSGSPVISFSTNIRKRTKPSIQQLQSSVLEKSVLSSTPFKNMRTATSIYKLSPISRVSCEVSPTYKTKTKEEKYHIPVIDDLKSPCSKKPSPNVFDVDISNMLDISAIQNNTSNLAQDMKIEKEDGSHSRRVENVECVSLLTDSFNESAINISLGGSKPSEVFLGFTGIGNEVDDEREQENVIRDINTLGKNEYGNSRTSNLIKHSDLELSLGGSKPSEPFLGFAILDNEDDDCVDNNSQTSDKTAETNKSNCNISSEFKDVASLYDTCSSDKNVDLSDEVDRVPIIEVTKMNDAVFQEYYNKMSAYTSDLSGDEDMDENSETSDSQEHNLSSTKHDEVHEISNDSDIIEKIQEVDSDSSHHADHNYSNADEQSDTSKSDFDGDTVSPQESESESETSMFEDLESNSNDDDEVRCFVNTRRRVTIKSNSNKSILNDSSSISSECNKTVLSNNTISINSPNSPNTKEISQNNLNVSNEDRISNVRGVGENININLDSDEIDSDTIVSFVTTRKSSSKFSLKPKSPDCSNMDKPSIVLQPGKKWERSLSIYRRMTMMNDYFDRSILEDESLKCKGRKYRQSVISTMEMQEGSLHNESISSRRSTFVAKPCRSTIVILKEPSNSRISLSNDAVYVDDLKGFLSDDCDDTIVELTKLSIADSDHEVTVIEKLHEDRLTSARDYVLRRCNQTDAILFDECYPDTALKNCHKIGEGVYGEVFLWRARDGRARVMKIVPVAGTTKVNGENQKDFHEIISEIVIAMELSALRTPIAELERQFDEGKKDIDTLDLHAIQNATDIFNEVLAVRCVYGSYTSRLLDLWDLYDECKGSENDNPAILPADQQYIVLELANAGQDLESYQFNSAEQAHALFLQVAFGLAVGEEAFQFEHRDLHWGNVLIAPTEQKYATFVLRGRSHLVPRRGVAATIIDYSLSRLSLPLARAGAGAGAGAGEHAALYNDLAGDDSLFDAVGDYQFEVYRLMREKLGNDWQNFEPYTNILWLHYTVDKMITALRYKRTNTKIHKHYISKLKAIKNRILDYGSAVQFVLTDIEY